MISDGYIEEPSFFEPYNPLRDDYIPSFYNSSEDLNYDQSILLKVSQIMDTFFRQ